MICLSFCDLSAAWFEIFVWYASAMANSENKDWEGGFTDA